MPTANIEAVFAPVSPDDPCGANLEYGDAAFTAFERAIQGKPEQQIGSTIIPAEEPDWKAVARQATDLLSRTKDLRLAVHLTKALLHTEGLRGLADGLTVLERFIANYWDGVHPRLDPEDGNDPTMRVNILSTLTAPDVIAAVRSTPLIASRTIGRFAFRDVETAAAESSAGPAAGNGASHNTLATIEAAGMDCDLAALQGQTSSALDAAATLKSLGALLTERLGPGVAPNLGPLAAVVDKVATFLKSILARRAPASIPAGEGTIAFDASASGNPGGGGSGEIRSREDVLRAFDRISAYYARHEPSSPIPLLMDRCKRLVVMSFMEIVRELAPDGVKQIETLAGQKES